MGVGLCAFLLAASGVASLADPGAPPFVERPGALAFSGQVIVRPLQTAALAARGLAAAERAEIRARARARVVAHVREYVPETDEYVVAVPAGEDENGYLARLMSTGDYAYAVPNWICHPTETLPNDGGYGMQWHHPVLRTSLAWDITTGDPGLIVAIVDSGIERTHPDLAAALVPGYNAADRLPEQNGGAVDDVDGHGTFVAGLAAAIGNNGTHVVGVGWNFSIMPVRYYNSPGGGLLSDILAGARWAVRNGARCVNVSQTGVEFAPVQTTGEYIRARGGLLFWAAGNDARDLDGFDWPDVIVVGGTDPSDARTHCSAYGRAVDVFAPGIDILSTGVPGVLAISGCGTSASTPMAAGVAGLLWSASPCLSPGEVEAALFAGCVDLGAPGEDALWGWGRVDAFGALLASPRCGDCDGDGMVGPSDALTAALCLAGPAVAVSGACECADTDRDADVDLSDLAALQTRLQP